LARESFPLTLAFQIAVAYITPTNGSNSGDEKLLGIEYARTMNASQSLSAA
jgi:hypothetical protein